MILLLVSLLAGLLSVLAPCVVSLLPVLIGRSTNRENRRSTLTVLSGLAVSIFIFTLILKASTLLIDIPQSTWQLISGGVIIAFGVTSLFPEIWEWLAGRLKLQQLSQKGSSAGLKQQSIWGDLLLGASLGPVFSACSPTYLLIAASILPATPVRGVIYLLAFLFGLLAGIFIITKLGQKLVTKLGWSINPKGWFKRTLGVVFILVGLLIVTGTDKSIQAWLVERGLFDWQVNLESQLQQTAE